MRILFGVFLVCLAALLWAAWSVSRAIRRHSGAVPGEAGTRAHEEQDEKIHD